MNQRDEIIFVAQKEIGYKEGKNNDNKYGKWYGMNNQPWCAMFVSWCAAQIKIPVSVIPKLAYVPYIYQFYRASDRYESRGAYTPKPGDIVLFGDNDHVGLVEEAMNGSLVTIEGNTSAGGNNPNGDGVYRRTRALTSSWIKGYCIPDYEEDDEVEIKQLKIKSLDSGKDLSVEAVNIDGRNFVLLRDSEKLFPVSVGFDGKIPTIKMNFK